MNISCASVDVISGNQNCLSSNDDSENNIPLARSKVSSSTKSPFQLLIPTPNYAVVKRNPRRKAINYKACIVTKDLFTDIEKKKDTRKKKMKENDSQRIDNKSKKPKSETKKKTSCKNNKRRSKTVFRKEDTMQKTTKERSNTSDEGNDIDKWYCYACHTERCEDMRQCPLCQKWFHEQCLVPRQPAVHLIFFICYTCKSNAKWRPTVYRPPSASSVVALYPLPDKIPGLSVPWHNTSVATGIADSGKSRNLYGIYSTRASRLLTPALSPRTLTHIRLVTYTVI
ncbi:hypothetical protein K1T71_011823 [Dendrolimus kikuchii]|uniref:Uncharacterized protein n=1 Tax=Dendrolimus kikuchii TaxID=765133 RepID=A0ACC1CM46_9NEOP|nr:hypothetical protein K1T71_011823 [Dendrolimus kikuchii]